MKRKIVDLKKLSPSVKAWWDMELAAVISEAVARACDIEVDDFTEIIHRKQNISEIRFIHAAMLKKHVPRIPLKAIAAYNGCGDHSSASKQLERCQEFLDSKCPHFAAMHYKSSWMVQTAVNNFKDRLFHGLARAV